MPKKPARNKYYEFEVSLMGAEPKVYRRFLLHKYSTFNHLHSAIQDACGWEDRHLFNFSFDNPYEEERPRTSVFAVSGWDEPSDYMGAPEYAKDVRLGFCFDDNKTTPLVYQDAGEKPLASALTFTHKLHNMLFLNTIPGIISI